MKRLLILPLVAGMVVAGCSNKNVTVKSSGLDISNLDTTGSVVLIFISMLVVGG